MLAGFFFSKNFSIPPGVLPKFFSWILTVNALEIPTKIPPELPAGTSPGITEIRHVIIPRIYLRILPGITLYIAVEIPPGISHEISPGVSPGIYS